MSVRETKQQDRIVNNFAAKNKGRRNVLSVLQSFVACLLCIAMVVMMSGCSEEKTVSDKKKPDQVKVAMNECQDEDANPGTLLLEGGEKIDIPDEFDDIQSNAGQLASYSYWGGVYWSKPIHNQGKMAELWRNAGSEFDENGFAMYKGRYGVVMKETFGEAGDYVDIVYKDGSILHAWLQDCKAMENAGVAWAKYGHGTDVCDVLEFYIKGGTGHGGDWGNPSYVGNFSSVPAKAKGFEFVTGTVDYVINYGSAFDMGDDVPNSSVTSTSGSSSSDSSEAVGDSSVKITFHRSWQPNGRSDPTDDFPDDNYRNTGTHDGQPGTDSPNIDTSTINPDEGHGDLLGFKYIVLHTTESNTSSMTDYDEEAKRIITAQNNATGDRAGVSAHFYVARNGNIYQHVDTSQISWHAGGHDGDSGEEFPQEVLDKGMNSYSVGIEIVHDQGNPYPEEQLEAVDALISYLRGGTTAGANKGETTCGENAMGKADNDNSPYNEKTGNEIVDRALKEQGKPYKWGAVGPDEYDCSGLVSYAILGKNERLGTTDTYMKYPQVTDPKPGDICTNDHHCGIYIGNGKMVHAPQSGDVVKISDVHDDMIYVRYSKN